jgi:hypothetical protein
VRLRLSLDARLISNYEITTETARVIGAVSPESLSERIRESYSTPEGSMISSDEIKK